MRKILAVVALMVFAAGVAARQSAAPSAVPSAPAQAQPVANAQFYAAADQVLNAMSRILDLPVKAPLKKSLRTREQIRQFLEQEEKKEESKAKRYADRRTLEAFGLIPRGFPLDSYLLDLLTEQVAGLYDPKAKEFYIADWIPVAEQKPVMAHELTHALDDQYFHLDKWEKAAGHNDDAALARDAVVEGSALAAMFDYSLHESIRDLPDLSGLISSGALSQAGSDPQLAKAPPFIRDELLFPYLNGAVFTQQFLKANSGWGDFKKVFENPPVSTQQILHPQLYLRGVRPREVALSHLGSAVPRGWKKLDENLVGEFGLQEILKQFLGSEQAKAISPVWAGDRYALFENKSTKRTLLVFRLAVDNAGDAARFFGAYSEALEKKYNSPPPPVHNGESLELHTPQGGVFLRCLGEECLSVEGANRAVFKKIERSIGWPAASAAAVDSGNGRARAAAPPVR